MKRVIYLFLVICFLGIVTGCGKIKDKSEEEQIKSIVNSIILDNSDLYLGDSIIKKDITVNSSEFENIYYVLGNMYSGYLFVKNDGSLMAFSEKKYSTTDSNIKKYESKLEEKIVLGFENQYDNGRLNSEKYGEYYFILKSGKIIRFDAINDEITQVIEVPSDGWRRTEIVNDFIKEASKEENIISWYQNNYYLLSDDSYKSFSYDYGKSSFVLQEEVSIPETIDIFYNNNFYKSNNNYYLYGSIITNKKECNEYADIECKIDNKFIKIDLKDLFDDIVFWDNNIMITKNNGVYIVHINVAMLF